MKKTLPIVVMVSALWLMFSCSGDKGQMLKQLEALEQMNRADSAMRNDSLAESLAAYFDNHGTANERMRAHYILGRTYFDLGELPKSFESFTMAEEDADTLSSDCDYATLCRVHAQKALLFRKQYMPQEELLETKAAGRYAEKAKDTIFSVVCYENLISPYYKLGENDSVLFITDSIFRKYQEMSRPQMAANTLSSAIYILLERKELQKAKHYLDLYRQGINDDDNNSRNRLGMLYSHLGNYLLYSGKPDSAVYYFRRQLQYQYLLENKVLGNKGLFYSYQKLGLKDSAMKYAELYNQANDSSNIFESAERFQRMQSLYRYERNQKIAAVNKQKAERYFWWLCMSIGIGLLIVMLIWQHFRRLHAEEKHRMSALNKDYHNIKESYWKAEQDIALMKSERDRFIKKKEKEISQYKSLLETFEQIQNSKPDSDLEGNALIKLLRKKASTGKTISDTELGQVFDLIDEKYPTFFSELERRVQKISYKQKCLCALTKLFFIPSEIGVLLNKGQQSVTNMRSRLAKRLSDGDSSASDFDIMIHAIN